MTHDDEDWPYPDPPKENHTLHARDLYTEDELKAFTEDSREQILARGGRSGEMRPCKCEFPTPGKKKWACSKCGGRIKRQVT